MTRGSQSTVEPTDRSLVYVTELLHRVQNEYTKAISFASMVATSISPSGGEGGPVPSDRSPSRFGQRASCAEATPSGTNC